MKVQLLTEPVRAFVLRIDTLTPIELAFACPRRPVS